MGVDSRMTGHVDFDKFKIVDSGTISYTKPASSVGAVTEVEHNLGYVPGVIAFGVAGDGNYSPLPEIVPNLNTGVIEQFTEVNFVDDTSIGFVTFTPDTGSNDFYTDAINITVKYYLLQETAN